MRVILQMIAFLAAGHIGVNAACTEKLDLAFLVDGSSTVCGGTKSCPNWDSTLMFIKEIVGSLTIGSDNSKVAFVKSSNRVEVEWNLNKYLDKTALLSAIGNVGYSGGQLNSTSGLKVITTDVFDSTFGDRPEVSNVLILITDGLSNINHKNATDASDTIQRTGVKVFVVGVTKRIPESLAQGLSSLPKRINETYFLAKDYMTIDSVRHNLVKHICPS